MNPLGPLIAAIMVIGYFEGRVGLKAWWRRIIKFSAPVWVYAVAFFVPLVLILISIRMAILIGTPAGTLPARDRGVSGPDPDHGDVRAASGGIVVPGLWPARTEAEMSPLAASLWIGLGVMVWHLPLLLGGNIRRSSPWYCPRFRLSMPGFTRVVATSGRWLCCISCRTTSAANILLSCSPNRFAISGSIS